MKFDPATEILATTGATLGVYAALMAMLNEGDEVLLPDPVYDAYQSPIRMAGGRVKSIESQILDGRFVITEEALERAWTPAAKAMVLNTPWNPAGAVLRQRKRVQQPPWRDTEAGQFQAANAGPHR